MVEQRDQLAREIDEELRREQLLKIWEQYGNYIIAVAILIIVGVGGVKYYQHRTTLAAEAAGGRFVTAARQIADSQSDARKELERIAAEAPTGYATLARLRLAAADAAAGKTIEAANAFDEIAKVGGADSLLRDYARLQSAMLRVDAANWTDMQNRLNDLAADGNAWRFSARELLGLAAHKAGKPGFIRATGPEIFPTAFRSRIIGQQVIDQLEWGDFQIQQAPIGEFYNPSGFYVQLVRENITPPQSFETSRKRELRQDALKTWQEEQEDRAALGLAYGAYLEQALEQYIRKNYSKEFYTSSVRSKLAQLLSQDQRLKQRWDEETLYRIAEKRLREEIAARVSSMTFQEFSEQHRLKIDSDRQLPPGCITVQSVRS
jgi:hypothetical protein